MKRTLKSIAPLQLGKIFAALYGLMALLFIPFFILFAAISCFAPHAQDAPPTGVAIIIALAMCIAAPIFYAVMGFIFGVIGAWLYNFIAKLIGGLQFEIE